MISSLTKYSFLTSGATNLLRVFALRKLQSLDDNVNTSTTTSPFADGNIILDEALEDIHLVGVCCSGNVSCSPTMQMFSYYLDLLQTYYIPLLILVGFVGNTLACLVLLTTHLKVRSSSYYLSALAVADTGCLLCFFITYCSSRDIFDLFREDGFCQLCVYLTYVCSFLSVWLIVAFTVERFIAVKYPLKKPYICTVSRAKMIVASLIGVSCISYIYVFWIATVLNDECQLRKEYQHFAEIVNYIDTVVTLIIPVVLIVGMNSMIARSLFRFRRKMQGGVLEEYPARSEQTELCHMNSQSTGSTRKSHEHHSLQEMETSGSKKVTLYKTSSDRETYSHIHIKKSSRYAMSVQIQQNINKMLLIISSTFIALTFPSYIIRLFAFFESLLNETLNRSSMDCIQQFTMLLYYTSFSINFLLYTMCGETFRLCLRTLFKNVFYKLTNLLK